MTSANVLAIDAARGTVLTSAGGALPVVEVDPEGTGTFTTRVARTLDGWATRPVPLLEVHGTGLASFDTVLVHVDLDEATTPPGCRWAALDASTPLVDGPLADRGAALVAEARGVQEVSALRPRWARRGWYDGAAAWVTDRLVDAGRPPTGRVEQVKHWPLSAVMRTDTATGPVWFKAVYEQFWSEPAVSALLDAERPGSVAPVIAVDTERGWLLLDDVGDDALLGHPEHDVGVIRRLVAIQRSFVDRTDVIGALGCPRRPFAELADPLEVALDEAADHRWLDRERSELRALVDWIRSAGDDVAALGFPETLVHGDFHPMNTTLGPDGPVIFDWSDTAIAHPLVDAMTWSRWLRTDPERSAHAWRAFLEAWSDVCPIERAEAARAEVVALTAAYHVLTYVQILRGFEPAAWPELASGIEHYVTILDDAVRDAGRAP
ncbi:MAG: hypothetical protein ABW328_19715 [Ilumatobacteraceae bacterium]